MEAKPAVAATAASTQPFLARHEFLLRRLHSLSGLIPVGAYMCVHLLTNASILNGSETFQKAVDQIHSLGKILPLVEWTFIFIPILFHAILGVVIIRGGLPNSGRYRYVNNVRYTLQRVTGMIAFAYIVWHVIQMHWLGQPLEQYGGAQFDPHRAASSTAGALQSNFIVPVLYAVGVLACVFHLANGLWTMGITWGVWITPTAQRRADYVCAAFGVGLAIVGLSAVFGFTTADIGAVRIVEDVELKRHEEKEQEVDRLLKEYEQRQPAPTDSGRRAMSTLK